MELHHSISEINRIIILTRHSSQLNQTGIFPHSKPSKYLQPFFSALVPGFKQLSVFNAEFCSFPISVKQQILVGT